MFGSFSARCCNGRTAWFGLRPVRAGPLKPLCAWQGPCQEVPHQRGDLGCLVLQREVAGLQRVVFGVRLVGEDLPDDLLWEYLVVGSGSHQRRAGLIRDDADSCRTLMVVIVAPPYAR
jgi:hypothetical protein